MSFQIVKSSKKKRKPPKTGTPTLLVFANTWEWYPMDFQTAVTGLVEAETFIRQKELKYHHVYDIESEEIWQKNNEENIWEQIETNDEYKRKVKPFAKTHRPQKK